MNNSLWMITSVAVAFLITAASGFWLIPILRKLKFGQTILEIGPKWHKSKQGTPTMGGLMMIFGVVLAIVSGYMLLKFTSGIGRRPDSEILKARMLYGLMLAIGLGLIGFVDDYLKITRRQNEGLSEKQKLMLQVLMGCAYLLLLYISGTRSTSLYIPFIGYWDIGIFYYPFALFAIIALANAVNFTDGLDGLLSSVSFMVAIGYMFVTAMLSMWEMSVMASALAGGCLGFLMWNFYPAKVFMGDTGSLFISGIVISLAFGTGMPLLVVLIGIIYVIEAGSVLLQRLYFKATHGKRIFKMSPIHHHYEMSGYSEVQITVAFTLVTAVGCGLGVLAVYLIR